MINERKLEIFKKYQGDVDYFGRENKAKEHQDMSSSDFTLIDNLIQDIIIRERAKFSKELHEKSIEVLMNSTTSDEVREELKQMALKGLI